MRRTHRQTDPRKPAAGPQTFELARTIENWLQVANKSFGSFPALLCHSLSICLSVNPCVRPSIYLYLSVYIYLSVYVYLSI